MQISSRDGVVTEAGDCTHITQFQGEAVSAQLAICNPRL